jgi:hypothetical protein
LRFGRRVAAGELGLGGGDLVPDIGAEVAFVRVVVRGGVEVRVELREVRTEAGKR